MSLEPFGAMKSDGRTELPPTFFCYSHSNWGVGADWRHPPRKLVPAAHSPNSGFSHSATMM